MMMRLYYLILEMVGCQKALVEEGLVVDSAEEDLVAEKVAVG
jgi:hypothetical protein